MTTQQPIYNWLPTSKKEVEARGWNYLDVILFSGDAYVDHPSFGAAVIARVLESEGLRVAVVPQPNWRDDLRDFKKLGVPRLFFAVTAGCMDSMVNHYTANKRLRSDDAYTPDNKAGARPDYPTIVYTKILKELYPEVPVVLGGIEASLRRLTHYDYWQDKLLPGILIQSGADMLVYGMGEKPIRQLVQRMRGGEAIQAVTDIPQTAYVKPKTTPKLEGSTSLFSFEECEKDKVKFAKNFRVVEEESNKWQAVVLTEACGAYIQVINPPYPYLSEAEIDASFDLPYTRLPHPRYKGKPIAAYDMIKFSVNLHRGCFGGCSFCTISAHQGKFVSSRSEASVLREIKQLMALPDFKGVLSDLGGPSANMYGMKGMDETICAKCKRPSCIYPSVCKNLNADHSRLLSVYKKVRELQGIKHAFIGSGIRYDLFLNEQGFLNKTGGEYFKTVMQHHVSGRLKVAPEHTADKVLKLVRKPSFRLFEVLKHYFDKINREQGTRLQLIPYFISSLPDCRMEDMEKLGRITESLNFQLEQVQDFTPTPMTLATTMYYTGLNPYTLEKIYVARNKEEKLRQKAEFFTPASSFIKRRNTKR